MSGEFYLLNALWFGAGLVILGITLPYVWRVTCFIVKMVLPFGLVAGFYIAKDAKNVLRDHYTGEPEDTGQTPANVKPMVKPKGK